MRLGYHVSISDDYPEVFQVFASNPRSLAPIFTKYLESIIDHSGIIHGPYGLNYIRNNPTTLNASIVYIQSLVEAIAVIKPKHKVWFVSHLGKVKEDSSNYSRFEQQLSTLKPLLEKSSEIFGLLLETDAMPLAIGQLPHLTTLCEKYPVNICLDTEHSYASGFSLDRITLDYWNYIKVVHLNTIPTYVGLGSGIDRHSDVPLQETKCEEDIINILNQCIERDIPMILERNHDLVPKDINYIKEMLKV